MACNTEAFDIFSHLLSKGARDDKDVMLCVAGGIAIFMGQNSASPIANAPLDPKIRQFAKTAKFAKFYRDKMRYLEELLKFKPLSEFEAKELEIFTKLAAVLDSEDKDSLKLINNKAVSPKKANFTRYRIKSLYGSRTKLKFLLNLTSFTLIAANQPNSYR